jgi:hypothetical protein
MLKEPTYWPVFRFGAGIGGEYLLLGILNSQADAEAFAEAVNAELPPKEPLAILAEFTLDAIKSHIIQYWVSASFPEHLASNALKALYDRNGKFPVAVGKTEEAAA